MTTAELRQHELAEVYFSCPFAKKPARANLITAPKTFYDAKVSLHVWCPHCNHYHDIDATGVWFEEEWQTPSSSFMLVVREKRNK